MTGAGQGAPASHDATVRLEATVAGRVQGVGFRVFVQRAATVAGCCGYVRNSAGGRAVEVVAEGPRPALEDLLAALRHGPRLARVGDVAVAWLPATGEFAGFSIRE